MSVSHYRWTEECEGDYCPGDCDYCSKNKEDEEMTEKERAFAWMDKVIEWRKTEPEHFSRDVWVCYGSAQENKILTGGVADLARITGIPCVTWKRDDLRHSNAYVEMYYKGWIFYDFYRREW